MTAGSKAKAWRLAIFCLLGFHAVPEATASAEKLVISTGKERGSYYYIGQRLKAEFILRYGELAKVTTSRGSLHNLSLLLDRESPVNVALSQADALDLYVGENPSVADDIVVIGDVGRECVYIIVAADGPKSAADLQSGKGTISVDDLSSGAEVTWRRMTQLAPGFAATTAESVPTMEGLLQLDAGSDFTDLRAVMLVSRPRRASPPLRHVLDHPGRFRFLPILASDLPSPELPSGRKVYTFERVWVGGKKKTDRIKVDTLCTHGLIVASKKKLDYRMRSRLSSILVESGKTIIGVDE